MLRVVGLVNLNIAGDFDIDLVHAVVSRPFIKDPRQLFTLRF